MTTGNYPSVSPPRRRILVIEDEPDLARGLRCAAGSNSKRLQEMVETANKWLGDLRALPRDPTKGLAAIDLLIQKNVMADDDKRLRCAVLIDHAGYVAPSGDRLDLSDDRLPVASLRCCTCSGAQAR